MPDSKLQTFRNVLKSKIVKSALSIISIFIFYKIFIYHDPKLSIKDKKKGREIRIHPESFQKKE